MLYIKSLLCLEKEKLSLLNKELKYLYLISDYYDLEETSGSSEKKDLEHSFNILKEQIEDIRSSIKSNFENLIKQIEWIEKLENKNQFEIQSLIYIDIIREYNKNIVSKIDLISIKISQLLRDGYNQYIPKPIIGKRHSSVNITSQAEFSLKKRLQELKSSNNVEALIIWDYNDEYRINKYSIKSKEYLVFNLSYWYFEFSYFLPNLTHEIGHFLQKNTKEGEKFNSIKLSEVIEKEFLKKEFLNSGIRNLSKILPSEIIADTIAFLYHGTSYIYALTHKLIGEGLSNTFKAVEDMGKEYYDEHHNIINASGINIENSILISRYRFNYKRDLIFIRLYILLEIRKIILNKKNNIANKLNCVAFNNKKILHSDLENKFSDKKFSNIDEIERLLNSMYHINSSIKFNEETSSSLDILYKDYHNFYNDYKRTQDIIERLYYGISSFFRKNQYIIIDILSLSKNNESKSNYLDIPKHFNDIWYKRFFALNQNKTIHRYEYRKKLHGKTLEKLISEKLLFVENIQPYSMVFIKFRIDKLNTYKGISKIEFKDKNKQIKEMEQGKVLGIYDYMYLRKLDSPFTITKLYKPKYPNLEKLNIKYYESSFSLMKIMNDTIGIFSKKNNMNAIIQIEIAKKLKDSNERDIYENLYKNLKDIHNIFNQLSKANKDKYYKIEYFKSLGPKDIIIRIDSSSIDFIFKIKKILYKKFNRTFTTFYIKNISYFEKLKKLDWSKANRNLTLIDFNYQWTEFCDKPIENKVVSNKKNPFVSNLRMHSQYDNEGFKKICKKWNKYINNISLKVGVIDFVVLWKENTELDILYSFYENLLKDKMVADIQTYINENVEV